MGHQDGRRAGTPQHPEHVGTDRGAQRRIERRKRLVEQHDLGLDRQGTSQRDPLLLAARQLVRVALSVARETHELEQLVNPLAPLRTAGKAERHVAPHAQVREQGPLLRHVADAAVLGGHEPVARVVDDLLSQT